MAGKQFLYRCYLLEEAGTIKLRTDVREVWEALPKNQQKPSNLWMTCSVINMRSVVRFMFELTEKHLFVAWGVTLWAGELWGSNVSTYGTYIFLGAAQLLGRRI